MKQYAHLVITSILLGTLSSSSCTPAISPDDTETTTNNRIQISTRVSAYSGTEAPGDNKYDDLTAYFFINNVFTEKKAITGDTLSAVIDKEKTNKVYFVANSSQFKELATLKVGSSDVSALLSAKAATSTPDGGAKMFMVASLDISSAKTKQTVDLVRGVARLDITLAEPGISILAVRVKNTASEAMLWAGTELNPTTTLYTKKFTTPATAAIPGVFYLYEHSNVENCTVEVDIMIKGLTTTAYATLAKNIVRNTVYEVTVKGTSISTVNVGLNIKEWGVGGVVDATPNDDAVIGGK